MRTLQRGESLVSILIGLFIAMIAILAMLSAYRMMIAVAVPAARTANREAQLSNALLSAQVELQQAGFGVDRAESAAKIFVNSSGTRVVWRYRETVGASVSKCSGLELRPGTGDDAGLFLLEPIECDRADDEALAFDARALATSAVFFEPDEDLEARLFDLSAARFVLTPNRNCGPFRVLGANPDRTLVELRDGTTTIFAYCLTNT